MAVTANTTATILFPVTDTTLDLRERRRLATRSDIESVALTLFAEQGCERTTVDDIAGAAGVSPRTFFRYFATKEDAALGAHRSFDAALSARLEAMAPGSGTLRDLEDAVADTLRQLAVDDPTVTDRMLRVRCLVVEDAALRGACLRMDAEHTRAFFGRVAAVTGAVTVDLRTRVLAQTLGAGLQAALDEWATRREAGDVTDLVTTYRTTCALLRSVVGS